MNPFKQTRTIISAVILIIMSGSLIASAALSPLTPPPTGGYDVGINSILDPGCTPGSTDCFVKSAWTLNGNTGTDPATDFLGTTDNQDVVFKRNNVEFMRSSAAYKLDVNGSTRISGNIGGFSAPLVVQNTGTGFPNKNVALFFGNRGNPSNNR